MPNRQLPLTKLETQRKLVVESLKRCPLCGAVNAVANGECFVCTWHGEFERDPQIIEAGLTLLLYRCPELLEAFDDVPTRPGPLARVKAFFGRLCRRPNLDLRV